MRTAQTFSLTGVAWALFALAARAELRFEVKAADVGEVRSGQPLRHRFAFVNAGAEPVEIIELRPSCGCLRPKLEQRNYHPGEQGVIDLEVDTLAQGAGPHRWAVRLVIRSGQAEHEESLELTGTIVTEVTVQPASLTITGSGTAEHVLILTDLRERPLSVTRLVTSAPWLQVRTDGESRNSAGHWSCRIRVSVDDCTPPGRHQAALLIVTNDDRYAELRIPITVQKESRGRITALPAELHINGQVGRPLPSPVILLRDRLDQAIDIDTLTVDNPAISCRWACGPGNRATLRLQIDDTRIGDKGLEATISVKISKPVLETVRIPIRLSR